MKVSELIVMLKKFQETNGDMIVVSTGFYDDNEVKTVELVKTVKWPDDGGKGEKVMGCRLLPGSMP